MVNRRRAERLSVDIGVVKRIGDQSYACRACEISPTGIRLSRIFDSDPGDQLVNIELPLVEGRLTTAVAARRVWRRGGFEAFEFVGASFAQQAMIERLFGNY